MSRTKEADLISAVLLYAARCLAEGDNHALRHLNFGTREVEALRHLTVADIERAGTLRGHFLDIQLDREVYWQIMAHLHREREAESVQHALIRADAPLEMLQALYGIGGREHTAICSLLGVRPSVGRPPAPDEETTCRIWAAYQALGREHDSSELAPADYLTLHRETGVSMRAIWSLVQESEGGAGPAGSAAAQQRRVEPDVAPTLAPRARPATSQS